MPNTCKLIPQPPLKANQQPRQDFEDSKSTTVADLGLDPFDVAEVDVMAEGPCRNYSGGLFFRPRTTVDVLVLGAGIGVVQRCGPGPV